MSGSMLWRFVRKDLYFNRGLMAASSAIGLAGLCLQNLGDTAAYSATIMFVTALILVSVFICMRGIFGERKEKALAFALSFPISPGQYLAAKVTGALTCFLVPGVVLGLGGLVMIELGQIAPGIIPVSVALWLGFLDEFCLMLAVTFFSDSDNWTGVTIATISISTSFFFYFVLRMHSVYATMRGPTAVWSQPLIGVITAELAVMALIAAIVWFFLARKRDFI